MNINELRPVSAMAPVVSTKLELPDKMGAVKVRLGIGRDHYAVTPGLYKIGKPDSQSDVLVSANYKLSFDVLRKNLTSLNVWLLVIDTKGVNVWCSAGKGTFGTGNLVNSIKAVSLASIVKHRRIIVPQLAASGVAAYPVKEQTGFHVTFGPVRALDIKRFIEAGYQASPAMRTVTFPMKERAKLIPVDFNANLPRLLIVVASYFFLSGLDKTGFLFANILRTSTFPIVNALGAYFAGIVVAPLFLPWMPFRAFALKGACWGAIMTILMNYLFHAPVFESIAIGFVNLSIASFLTMNFTGSSTYTSLSGVKKEMKWAIPFQVTALIIGAILFILSKLI